MPKCSDLSLIINYCQGNEKSLEILIKRYFKLIYKFIYRYIGNQEDAEEITQEVFIKVWRNLQKFDQNKSFKIWVFVIAKNTCLDWLKKKRTVLFSELEHNSEKKFLPENIIDTNPSPDKILERQDLANFLNKALENLSLQYRIVLFLRYNDHFTFKEIAEILGEPLNTIKSRHRRAIIALKKLLEGIDS